MDRGAGGPGKRLERVLDELERELADALAPEGQVDHGIRPPAEVDDGARQRLVHRHPGIAEAADPGPIAERGAERAAEDEGDVLDRVVLIDRQVTVGPDLEVEQAVMAERAEQVVPEADPGGDRDPAAAVEVDDAG